jgi:hypothetical protein
MKTFFAAVLFAALAAPGGAAAPSNGAFPALFTGTVSDSECGLDHTRMKKQHHLPNDLACTRECCEKYKQDYVLADHAAGDVYQLDDQKSARRFANRVVRVLGTLDAESGTIHVLRMEPAR